MNNYQLCQAFAEYLVDNGVIDSKTAQAVLDGQRDQTPPIGRLALKLGFMDMKQVSTVLNDQVDSGLLFGEQAIALGFINQEQLDALLAHQRSLRPRIGDLLVDMGALTRNAVKKHRRAFVSAVEGALV